MNQKHLRLGALPRAIVLGLGAVLAGVNAPAAMTDIATAPLVSSTAQRVRPNLMFILDDSGSMSWGFMPDQVPLLSVGQVSSQCNDVYYDPARTYAAPPAANGTSYPDSNFTNAWTNGFDTAAGTTDLSTSFQAYDLVLSANWGIDVAQPAYYYTYGGTELSEAQRNYGDTTGTYSLECRSAIGSPRALAVFTRRIVAATPGPNGGDQRTNFANWYSYYRTRMLTMKSATGLAFAGVGDDFRVGFMSVNNNTGASWLNIGPFDAAQKTLWYSKLYGAAAGYATPLREALSKAGNLYAGTAKTLNGNVTTDPVQYACQKNVALLSTDGYWNMAPGFKTDGVSPVGDQDGAMARPYADGGDSDTLADVAMYYYKTDLRPGLPDLLVPTDDDPATWQHMTTFTLGLGARGRMMYSPGYAQDTSGDFAAVKLGLSAPAHCAWQTSGPVCNWPHPSESSPENIDDLWHAAVNGHGKYFSTRNAQAVEAGLSEALESISREPSAGATPTVSNPNVSSGDNFRFASQFTPGEWTGDVRRFDIDLVTGAEAGAAQWSASAQLDAMGFAARKVYTYSAPSGNRLKRFTWAELNAAEKAWFSLPWVASSASVPGLTQFCAAGATCLSAADQASASGAALVSYLAGDRSHEGGSSDPKAFYRQRRSALGDLVSARLAYVKAPRFLYTDAGYQGFKADQKSRRPAMVYGAANDGMLHAFDAETGAERWAHVPSMMLPTMFKLADKRYKVNHQYYVDGTPVEADVRFTSDGAWHTVIVGGLNRGARGYYALDVTDPLNPRALWEFTHPNLGYSFGKPEVTKLKSGDWVVLVTSGYNNVNPGDGRGYLFVLDAATGALRATVGTGVGDTTTPSGLAQIRAWVDNGAYDNTALRVYGGDLAGNVWRFDVNGDIGAPGIEAHRLATLIGPLGKPQPVTTRPELSKVADRPVVYVGTGRTLGLGDIEDANVQSIYALKDALDASALPNPRDAGSKFVKQAFTDSTCNGQTQRFCDAGSGIRTASGSAVDFTRDNGWYVDLPAPRERVDTDLQLAFGVLGVATNVPSASACVAGGSHYVNFIDYATGGALSNSAGMVSLVRENLSTGLSFAVVGKDSASRKLSATESNSKGQSITTDVPTASYPTGVMRRAWRELRSE